MITQRPHASSSRVDLQPISGLVLHLVGGAFLTVFGGLVIGGVAELAYRRLAHAERNTVLWGLIFFLPVAVTLFWTGCRIIWQAVLAVCGKPVRQSVWERWGDILTHW